MDAGLRTGTWIRSLGLATALASASTHVAAGQTSASEARLLVPTIQVGLSAYSAEFEGDDASDIGLTLKGGIRIPYLDITGLVERWDQINGSRFSSVLLEASYYFAGQRRVAPFVIVAAGHTWQRYTGDYPIDLADDGAAAGFGLGVRVSAALGIDARVEGLLRTDVGGYSGAARALLGWAPALLDPSPERYMAHGDAFLSWMVPISGPWRFVEPGFGLRFARSANRWGGSLGLAVFHWDIPGDMYAGVPGLERRYIWDTRAFVATPGVVWHAQATLPVELRAGPSIVIMGEGPGNGANFGGHLEAVVSSRSPVAVGAGVGWFWMQSENLGDSRFTNADQHGLTVFLAVGF